MPLFDGEKIESGDKSPHSKWPWTSADCECIITIGGPLWPTPNCKLDVRREQIAEAALQLVAAEGVKRLSIAAVARRVGLVPSGIYRHFPSKDAMLDAVLDLLGAKLQANVAAAEQETADPMGRLHDLFLRHIRVIRSGGQAFPRIVFSDEGMAARSERKTRVRRIVGNYLAQSNAWSATDSGRAASTAACCPTRSP